MQFSLYRSQGNTIEAIEYYRRSLQISMEIGDKAAVAVSLNNIGQIFHNTGDITRVLEYSLKGLIFLSFLIFFEFMPVLADPYLESWSGGAPGVKLLFNAGLAAFIFPLHAVFEKKLKNKLVHRNNFQ